MHPFWQGEGSGWDGPRRDFVREAERNLRLTLDWSHGEPGAAESLLGAMQADPAQLVRLVDFALHNITIGYALMDCEGAAGDLDRILRESGAAWEVVVIRRPLQYSLQRRVDATTSAALDRLSSEGTPEAKHLAEARRRAFGQSPDPGKAYDEAVKAVEAVVVPVVLPNDPKATLGKAIGEMRNDPVRWSCTFTRPTSTGDPIDTVIGMLDLLWKNETERHAPVTPITQEQAESAVHLALTLVQMFRTGAIARR
jgi:hypothetical protein